MAVTAMAPEAFEKIALGIDRPEDVVVLADGRVFASEHQCAVAQIHPDGSFTRMGPRDGAPNGINATPDGRILIANFGIYDGVPGPLELFDPATGVRSVIASEVEGRALTSSNYPVMDAAGHIWCANSTHAATWPEALDGRPDGFVYVVDPDGTARVVAEGLRFPNGLAISADGAFLYCCQTSAANVVRFAIDRSGPRPVLGEAQPYGPQLGHLLTGPVDPGNLPPPDVLQNLGYTDGCGLDAEGNLWVTLPAANKIVAITPAGEAVTIVHDTSGTVLNHPTNVTWGGSDLRDLYVGSIRASYVLKARSPVPGQPLVHQTG
jgi:gluconolactonase